MGNHYYGNSIWCCNCQSYYNSQNEFAVLPNYCLSRKGKLLVGYSCEQPSSIGLQATLFLHSDPCSSCYRIYNCSLQLVWTSCRILQYFCKSFHFNVTLRIGTNKQRHIFPNCAHNHNYHLLHYLLLLCGFLPYNGVRWYLYRQLQSYRNGIRLQVY